MEISTLKPAFQKLSIKVDDRRPEPSKDVGTLGRAASQESNEGKDEALQVASAPDNQDSEEQELKKGLDLTA